MSFPHSQQRNQMDCGPTCLYIICKHYKLNIAIEKLRELSEIGKEGVSLLGISNAAEKIGFKTLPAQCTLKELANDIKFPAILLWGQQHFVVLYKIKSNPFYISDPAKGLVTLNEKEFTERWISSKLKTSCCFKIRFFIEIIIVSVAWNLN